jgi:hypothetical protein
LATGRTFPAEVEFTAFFRAIAYSALCIDFFYYQEVKAAIPELQ